MKDAITRREALARMGRTGMGAAALSTLAPWLEAAEGGAEGRPNILFVMSDDHAASAVSCYGSRINTTPNIDRLAREGRRFDNCFTTNSICGPSRASILTGKYSHIHGYKRNAGEFDGSQWTFPKRLRDAGYHTAIVGKWHLKSDPTGFDYWNVLPGQGKYFNPPFIRNGHRERHKGYVSDVITDLTIEHMKQMPKDRPFCMLCHHKAVHGPQRFPRRYADLDAHREIPQPITFYDQHEDRSEAPREAKMLVENNPHVKHQRPTGLLPLEAKRWSYQKFIKDYIRCVAALDDNVGRLLDYVDQAGLARNTIVIYTSDQGYFIGEHGWFDKRFMYEPSLRMPLLVRYPPGIQAGSTDQHIVINTDFAPTFCDYAARSAPDNVQGRSLRPLLEGGSPADWRQAMYYEYYEYPAFWRVRQHEGVRTQRYKLIHFYNIGQWELFDLLRDPHELHSVYDDTAYAEVQKRMKAQLHRLRRKLDVPAKGR